MNKIVSLETRILVPGSKRRGIFPTYQKNQVEKKQRYYIEVDASFSDTHCKVWIPDLSQGALLTNKQFFNIWGDPRNSYQVEAAYQKMNDFVVRSFGNKNYKKAGQTINWITEDVQPPEEAES